MKGGDINSFVVDASYVLSYLLPDESHPKVNTYFRLHKRLQAIFIAPTLLPFEVSNGLKSNVLRKRLDSNTALTLISAFEKLNIVLESINYGATFTCSLEEDLSFYDAAYVELARQKQLRLLTLDDSLARLASHRG